MLKNVVTDVRESKFINLLSSSFEPATDRKGPFEQGPYSY